MGILSLNSTYKYKLKAFNVREVDCLEVHDLLFHHDSAVMMPGPAEPGGPDQITGIVILAVAYRHAENNPEKGAIVVGHTDTSGSDDYNVKLSWQRAENVYYLLAGRKDDWVTSSDKKDKVEDRQQILKWLSTNQGWDCDPGKVDNVDGSGTQGALKKFQQQYNQKFSKSIKEDGKIGKETWEAFFDVYMDVLAALLETDAAGLDEARGALQFLESGKEFVGCGENFPLEAVGVNNFRSQTNRRVEILFIKKEPKLALDCHPGKEQCVPDKCLIYKSGTIRIKPIPPWPIPAKEYTLQTIAFGFDPKKKDVPLSGRPWQLLAPKTANGKTGSDGLIKNVLTVKDTQATLSVDIKDTPAAPAEDPPPTTAATDYPIKIKPADFQDKNAEPPLPPASDDDVKWTLTITTLDKSQDDESIKARLHNLGFGCDAGSDADTTTRAVKAYQALYLNQKDGSGALADIKDDVKKRHDNP